MKSFICAASVLRLAVVAMSTEVTNAPLDSSGSAAEQPVDPSANDNNENESTGSREIGSPQWLDYMTDRSERGDSQAHFSLGQYHYEKKDYTKALSYFNMADNKGNIQATYQLAVMYYDGLGVVENQVCARDFMYLFVFVCLSECLSICHKHLYRLFITPFSTKECSI